MGKTKLIFTCENDGEIPQDLVSFLCNKCSGRMIKIADSYICEDCLTTDAKFECRLCSSQEVTMQIYKKQSKKNFKTASSSK